jgi:transcriptional regulator with XRE-family HTH domain
LWISYVVINVKTFTSKAAKAELKWAKVRLAALGLSHRKIAKLTGLARGTVSNVLSGHHQGWPAKAAINHAIGLNIFTPPSNTQSKNMNPDPAPRFSIDEVATIPPQNDPVDPAAANLSNEWVEQMGKIGFTVCAIEVRQAPPVMKSLDFEEWIGAELNLMGLGHIDSFKWGNPFHLFLYLKTESLPTALKVIQGALSKRGVWEFCKVAYSDPEEKVWRTWNPISEGLAKP